MRSLEENVTQSNREKPEKGQMKRGKHNLFKNPFASFVYFTVRYQYRSIFPTAKSAKSAKSTNIYLSFRFKLRNAKLSK